MKYKSRRHDHPKAEDTEPQGKTEKKPFDKPAEFVKSSCLRITATPAAFLIAIIVTGCQNKVERQDVRPLILRDVPAQRLAYHFEADTGLPSDIKTQDTNEQLATIRTDFIANRKADALIRTVLSPDGQRVLALYGTAEEPNEAFRIQREAQSDSPGGRRAGAADRFTDSGRLAVGCAGVRAGVFIRHGTDLHLQS